MVTASDGRSRATALPRDAERWDGAAERTATPETVHHLGTIGVGQTVVAHTTASPFDASYDAGGEDITLPAMPGADVYALALPKAAYYFEVDVVAGKIIAFTAGAEAIGDLTGLNPVTVLVFGTSPHERVLHRASDSERVLEVHVRVSTTLAKSATDFWTLTAVIQRAGGRREEVGSLTSASAAWTARVEYALVVPGGTWRLEDGDELRLEIVESGLPAALEELAVRVVRRREVV